MGCLFFPLELLVDVIIEGWFLLMAWIIPEKISRKLRIALKIFVWVFCTLLLCIMCLGVFAIISDDPYTKLLGKYMIFVPLGISVVQILLGILGRFISGKKK